MIAHLFLCSSLLLLLSIVPSIRAQNISDIPGCALYCFAEAISFTSCSLTDFYCQCTSGQKVIEKNVMSCLCNTTCDSTELFKIEQGTLKICREALASSSQTYIAPTITSIECQGVSATSLTAHRSATTTSGGGGTTAGSTNHAVVFPTVAPLLQSAMLGMAGLAAAYAL